jgi:hypothetical protein
MATPPGSIPDQMSNAHELFRVCLVGEVFVSKSQRLAGDGLPPSTDEAGGAGSGEIEARMKFSSADEQD